MRRLSSYLIVMVLGFSSAVVAGDIVLRTSVTPKEAWVGQRVILGIDVLSDSGWAQITQFGELDVAGTYVMRTDSQGIRLQETIDGVSYTGQRYELSIYPQRAGAVEIPALPIEVTTKVWGAGATETVQQATTPATTLLCKVPPGSEDIHGLISTTRLTAKQTWVPKIDKPKVGDAIKRTIEFLAADVSGMAFAPLQHDKIPGLGIYPAEPAVKDTASRGSLTGMRTEVVTYVLEQSGEMQIPDFVLTWWNVTDKKLEHVELPGLIINVAAGPADTVTAVRPLNTRLLWLAVIMFLVTTYLLLHFRKRMAQRWAAWRKSRNESEARYFRLAVKSIRSKDADAALRDLMRWLDRVNDADRPAQFQDFLRRHADTDMQAAMGQFLRSIAKGDRLADPSPMVDGLSAARDRWREAGQPKRNAPFVLPELNRT